MPRLVQERVNRRTGPARVIALDEMWTYVQSRRKGKRRSVWIWTAVIAEADGRRWVDFEIGDRSETTFLRLLARLPETVEYRSDYYSVYGWLPPKRHTAGKGGAVNWNEGLHSRWRDKLKRLQRQTKGYTKSLRMLRDSLALVCLRLELI